MPDFLWPIIFVASLVVLLKSSDFFVGASEKLGLKFGIPSFVIGVTIVAFGTSLPELITSIIAVVKDKSEIVVGNVVGSNISNLFLIIGISAFVSKGLKTRFEINKVDTPMLLSATAILVLFLVDGSFDVWEAVVCCVGLVLFLFYSVSSGGQQDDTTPSESSKGNSAKLIGILILTGALIFLSAKYNVDSIIEIARMINVGEEVIALTAVSLGTSLPELVVCLAAIKMGNSDMALGNVIGSNIFNTFGVMGIPALIGAGLSIPLASIGFSLLMLIAGTAVFLFMVRDKEISKWSGAILIFFYLIYLMKIFQMEVA